MAKESVGLPQHQVVALVAAILVRQPPGNLPNDAQMDKALSAAKTLVGAAYARTGGT